MNIPTHLPFLVASRAILSQSTTGTPDATKAAETVLFPVAIPPVSPISRIDATDHGIQ